MKWWPVSESNQGHNDFQSFALPTELTGPLNCVKMVELYLFKLNKILKYNILLGGIDDFFANIILFYLNISHRIHI